MEALSVWGKKHLGLCLVVFFCFVAVESAWAQGRCTCRANSPFADCVTQVFGFNAATSKDNSYPDLFPGTGTIVPRASFSDALATELDLNDDHDVLYIADLFSGRTYTYQYETVLLESVNLLTLEVTSPGGGQSTTGITFVNEFLIWAVTNNRGEQPRYEIWRTDITGGDVVLLGTVDMTELANLVREDSGSSSIVDGKLGGIVYHPTRASLWGVDIVNDLYFEFQTDGTLVLNAEGKPNYFFNPLRNEQVGGAYGNDLTYISNADGEFFDLTVGALSDGRPSRVTRVRALPGEGTAIGDETGVFYLLDEKLGSPQFVTGIVHWSNSCSPDQHSEFIFDIDLAGGDPRVFEITADNPTAGTAGGFTCRPDTGDSSAARLNWRKDFSYTSLQITRRNVQDPPASAEVVFMTMFDQDPQQFLDTGLLTGTYEYVLTVQGGAGPPQSCRVNVGRGGIVLFRRSADTEQESPVLTPYATTLVPGDTLVVADIETGQAQSFDLELNPKATVAGPGGSGLTTGLAYNSSDGLLYWLENDGGSHFLTGVALDGQGGTDPVRVDVPANFERGLQLGDITYDQVHDWFWTIDLLKRVILPIRTDGSIPAAFSTEQISVEDTVAGFTGGLFLVNATDDEITLDLPLTNLRSGGLGDYARLKFDINTMRQSEEVFRFDLVSSIDTGDVGSLAVEGRFGFVVDIGSAVIYKLQVESSGLPFFRRGDVNNDGDLNISDPSALLGHLFLGGASPLCMAAADGNKDSKVELADAVFLFNHLFAGGVAPGAPFPNCGTDASTTLDCLESSCSAR